LYALHYYLDSDRLTWLLLAALCAGLAPVTDLIGIILPLFLAPALLLHRPRHLLVVLPLFVLPPLAWGIWMWKVGGEAFLFDTAFAFARVSASLPLQLARLIFFYRQGLEYDLWFALGNFGLLLLPHRRSRWLIGGFYFVSLFALLRTVDIAGLGYYYAMPLFPFIAVGVALSLAYGLPYLLKRLQGDILHLLAGSFLSLRWRRLLAFCLNTSIVFLIIVSLFTSIVFEALFLHYGSFTDRLDSMDVLADPETATSPDDLVLCSPTIAWLLHAHAADFQMAVAATGRATQHFPADIPFSRFRFDPRLENATYVILDPLWRGWASARMPEVAEMVREVEEGWGMERRFGEFEVYRHPSAGEGRDD